MNEVTIYNALRAGGLSAAGACAMIGNMWCESALISNNVQDNCTLGDFDYTNAVDSGTITRWQFMADGFGYGLCQWTHSSRKFNLWEQAHALGVSIGDGDMQVGFCLAELQSDFPELYKFLCETDDLAAASDWICKDFENPAVKNFADRQNAAARYFKILADLDVPETAGNVCSGDSCTIDLGKDESCSIDVRVLKHGDMGRDVYMLQCGLSDMGISCGVPDGDFGGMTLDAVKNLQQRSGLEPTGIVDASTWQMLVRKR